MLVYFFSSLQFLLYCVTVFFKISLISFVLSYAVFFELFYGLLFIPCFFMYYMAFLCIDVLCVEFASSLSAFDSCATESILWSLFNNKKYR